MSRRASEHLDRRNPPEPAAALDHSEILRRALLGLVTALIVARPMVLGEDPGFLSSLTRGSGLVFSVLWFLAAIGTATWRLWSGIPGPRIHPVELGLGILAGLAFLSSAISAHYRFPAWLISWEWLIFLLAFGVVRRLVRSADESGRLLASLLAVTAAISAYALYQYGVEFPRNRAALADRRVLQREVARLNIHFEVDDPRLDDWLDRVQQKNVFATYAHPNSFAGLLALVAPILVGWTAVAWRRRRGFDWKLAAALAGALLVLAALWFTHSRGAIIGSLLAIVGALLVRWQSWPATFRRWFPVAATVTVLVLAGLTFVLARGEGFQKAFRSLSLRGDYWVATVAMVGDHFWMGVGPGNFGRLYPHYMSPTAHEKIIDPHNFFLETAAASGVFAPLILAATLAAFYFYWLPGARLSDTGAPAAAPRGAREFLLGGLLGLMLAFLLRSADLGADELSGEFLRISVFTAIWFLVYLALEAVPWGGPDRQLALGIGVTALLFNLLISGGISQPSVAQLLWVACALALPPLGEPVLRRGRTGLLLAGVSILAVLFMVLVYFPVLQGERLLDQARRSYGDAPEVPGWRNSVRPAWEAALQSRMPAQIEDATRRASGYLNDRILVPLEEAQRAVPGNSATALELANWYMEKGLLFPESEDLTAKALKQIRLVQKLDPDNVEPYLVEARLQIRRARGGRPQEAKDRLGDAIKAMTRGVERDPTEAALHYELADLLFRLPDPQAGKKEATRALELNDLSTQASRKLTAKQLQAIKAWLEE